MADEYVTVQGPLSTSPALDDLLGIRRLPDGRAEFQISAALAQALADSGALKREP